MISSDISNVELFMKIFSYFSGVVGPLSHDIGIAKSKFLVFACTCTKSLHKVRTNTRIFTQLQAEVLKNVPVISKGSFQ